jgi:hypothetical protein
MDWWALFWAGAEAIGTWIAVAVAGVAAYFAVKYARSNEQLVRLEHTPAVRMTRTIAPNDVGLIFKNVGRGAALGIFLTDSKHQILPLQDPKGGFRNTIDVLDQATGGPLKERLGRYTSESQVPLPRVDGDLYFIYYQDFDGRWYQTIEHVLGNEFRSEFCGEIQRDSVPHQVKQQSQVWPRYLKPRPSVHL